MGAVTHHICCGIALTTILAAPCGAQSVADWRPLVTEASLRFGVPVAWIERVIEAESGGSTTWQGRPIRSRAGAIGLMQLMPATWAEMRARYRLGDDPDDPHDNILAGTAYLRLMYDRFGYPGLFAAYNAGPGRFADHLGGRALPAETRAYLAKVAGSAGPGASAPPLPPRDRLFVTIGSAAIGSAHAASVTSAPAQSPSALFAVLPRQ